MATRLHYAPTVARELAASWARRLRPGGLAAALDRDRGARPLVIVAGAGRSGTSAVARVLHESGVRMGERLGEASDFNPDGFYEDLDVVWLHERMLVELGMNTIWRPERWPWRSTVLAVARRYRDEMRGLLARAQDGWKDPRFAVTLEAWLPLLSTPPKLVVCLRSPQAYADSVTRIFGVVEPAVAERMWARHYQRLLAVIRDYQLDALCVEYDTLVDHAEETVADLARFVGRPLDARFVTPPHRRFRRPVPRRYIGLYRAVLALGTAGPTPQVEVADGASARGVQDETTAPASAIDLEAVEAYLRRVGEVEAQVRAAEAVWRARLGLPTPRLLERDRRDGALPDAVERARVASASFAAATSEAQAALAETEPPPGFERYHQAVRRLVDVQRLVAQLALNATERPEFDRRTFEAAVRGWRKASAGRAAAALHRERDRAYAEALARLGRHTSTTTRAQRERD